jgi:LacI family transcriptional regulator
MPRASRKKPGRAATLADVGRAAGVSAMAASVVLNGARSSSRIAPETRARILTAAAKLRYRPNAAARALAERRMHTIGVAAVVDVGGELNHYFLEVFNGILEAATRHRQNTTVDRRPDPRRPGAVAHGDPRIAGPHPVRRPALQCADSRLGQSGERRDHRRI